EYLRRNPRYQRDWVRCRRSASHGIAAQWGLATLVDPRLDARQVVPVWTLETRCLITLVTDESPDAARAPTTAEVFSLWNRSDRRGVFQKGGGLRLILHRAARTLRLRLGPQLREGDRFAYQIPAVADVRAAWNAVSAFRALLPTRGGGMCVPLRRPGRADLFHVRALQVLDGLAAGASQRELAVALFGSAAVARGWQPDGALRAQVRYLIQRAKALREGEYRGLITNGLDDSR
ncbi:MAG: DUF2285 domain-containing protein, partial [Steroidobacteraceae bacterium]